MEKESKIDSKKNEEAKPPASIETTKSTEPLPLGEALPVPSIPESSAIIPEGDAPETKKKEEPASPPEIPPADTPHQEIAETTPAPAFDPSEAREGIPDMVKPDEEKSAEEAEKLQTLDDAGTGREPPAPEILPGQEVLPPAERGAADPKVREIHDLQRGIVDRITELRKAVREGVIPGRQEVVLQMKELQRQISELAVLEKTAAKILPGIFQVQSARLSGELEYLNDAWTLAMKQAEAPEKKETSAGAGIPREQDFLDPRELLKAPSLKAPLSEEPPAEKPPVSERLSPAPQAVAPSRGASPSKKYQGGSFPDKKPGKRDAKKALPPVVKGKDPLKQKSGRPLMASVFSFLGFLFFFLLIASALVFGVMFFVEQLRPAPENTKKPLTAVRPGEEALSPAFKPFFTGHPESLEKRALNVFVINLKESARPESRKKCVTILKGWSWKGVPDVLLETAVQDKDAQVSREAFAAFKSMTGYTGSEEAPFAEAEAWWGENKSEIEARLEDAE